MYIRNWLGLIVLFSVVAGLLSNVMGPILSDGVAFFGPILACSVLAWLLLLRKRDSSTLLRAFLVGGFAGLLGNIVWPTLPFLIVTLFSQRPAPPGWGSLLYVSLVAALMIGGSVSCILQVCFFNRNPKRGFAKASANG